MTAWRHDLQDPQLLAAFGTLEAVFALEGSA